jgi:hypothetical protein
MVLPVSGRTTITRPDNKLNSNRGGLQNKPGLSIDISQSAAMDRARVDQMRGPHTWPGVILPRIHANFV